MTRPTKNSEKQKNLFDKIENEEDEINAKEYKFEAPVTIEQGRHSLKSLILTL